MTPSARTLQYLRKQGHICQTVEKWNPFARIRQDLFQIFDIISVDGTSIIGVQCTTKANMSARRKKILASEILPFWKQARGKILLIGWFLNKSNRWECKVEDF